MTNIQVKSVQSVLKSDYLYCTNNQQQSITQRFKENKQVKRYNKFLTFRLLADRKHSEEKTNKAKVIRQKTLTSYVTTCTKSFEKLCRVTSRVVAGTRSEPFFMTVTPRRQDRRTLLQQQYRWTPFPLELAGRSRRVFILHNVAEKRRERESGAWRNKRCTLAQLYRNPCKFIPLLSKDFVLRLILDIPPPPSSLDVHSLERKQILQFFFFSVSLSINTYIFLILFFFFLIE